MWETWGGWLAGWGGFREGGIVEEEEEAWAVVLLGLCLLLGLLGGCLHLWDKADEQGQNAAAGSRVLWSGAVGFFLTSTHLVGLGLSVLRVVFLVCLCLCVLLRLLGLLVLLLVVHSLFFLQGKTEQAVNGRPNTHTRPASSALWCGLVSYLCCLLGLWFRLGRSWSLRRQRGKDQVTTTYKYNTTFFATLIHLLVIWRYDQTLAPVRHFLNWQPGSKLLRSLQENFFWQTLSKGF